MNDKEDLKIWLEEDSYRPDILINGIRRGFIEDATTADLRDIRQAIATLQEQAAKVPAGDNIEWAPPVNEPEPEYKWPIAITSTEIDGRYKHPASGDILRRVGMTSYVKSIIKNNRFLFINEKHNEVWCYDEDDFDLLSLTNPNLTTVGELKMWKRCNVMGFLGTRIPSPIKNLVLIVSDSGLMNYYTPDIPCERVEKQNNDNQEK